MLLKITALATASVVCVALLGCDGSSSSGGGGQPNQVRKVEPGSAGTAPGKAGAAASTGTGDAGAGKK
jgi:hypothetical protein